MKKPLTNMRVLLLAALAATAYGDGHEMTCAMDCVSGIYTAVKTASASAPGNTYKDGDMAVYAYALYRGYAHSGEPGAAWVGSVITYLASADVCDNTGKRDEMKACFDGAEDADVKKITDFLADTTQVTAELKEGYEFILGAIANQIAPGSKPALEWPGLDSTTFDAALKVYYIVGAFAGTISPIIAYAFDTANDATAAEACYGQLYTAIDYVAGTVGKQDMAYAIAMKGEKLFGTDGLKHASCFGTDSTVVVAAGDVTKGDGTTLAVTDIASILTATDAAETTATTAITAALEAAKPATADPESGTSPAAALSALIATVALML